MRKLYVKGEVPQPTQTPVEFELEQDGRDVNIFANYDGKRVLVAFFSTYSSDIKLELMSGLDATVFASDEKGFLAVTR